MDDIFINIDGRNVLGKEYDREERIPGPCQCLNVTKSKQRRVRRS